MPLLARPWSLLGRRSFSIKPERLLPPPHPASLASSSRVKSVVGSQSLRCLAPKSTDEPVGLLARPTPNVLALPKLTTLVLLLLRLSQRELEAPCCIAR